jgi:CRP-like cAMP-binding protein
MTAPAHAQLPTIPLERMPLEEVLGCVEPFSASDPADIERLGRHALRLRRSGGAVLVSEGQQPDGLYVVLRGRVNLIRMADGGRDVILSVLGSGEVFGESCAFDTAAMSTSAVAATNVEVLRIPAEVVADHVRTRPETLVRLTRLVSRKLRDLENVASGLALCDVEERLRRTLVRLARCQGRRSPTTSAWILAPMPTQSELARMVGSCRETVSRTLSAMARSGLVTPSGRRMILDASMVSEAA